MQLAPSPAADHLRDVIRQSDMKLAMVEGFLIAPPASNIMEQTIGLLQEVTIPLHYAVGDPALPYGIGAPASDGYRMLMDAQHTLQAALHGDMDMDEAQMNARQDVRTGRQLLKTAASYRG